MYRRQRQPLFFCFFPLDFGMTVTWFFFGICRVRDTHSAHFFETGIIKTIVLKFLALRRREADFVENVCGMSWHVRRSC
jgi:hypothetical protein